MSTFDGAVEQAATLSPQAEPGGTAAARLPGHGIRAANFLIIRGWALPALDFVALAGAFACAAAITDERGPRLALSVFPILAVLVLSARGAYAQRLRLIVIDSIGPATVSISF